MKKMRVLLATAAAIPGGFGVTFGFVAIRTWTFDLEHMTAAFAIFLFGVVFLCGGVGYILAWASTAWANTLPGGNQQPSSAQPRSFGPGARCGHEEYDAGLARLEGPLFGPRSKQ